MIDTHTPMYITHILSSIYTIMTNLVLYLGQKDTQINLQAKFKIKHV